MLSVVMVMMGLSDLSVLVVGLVCFVCGDGVNV